MEHESFADPITAELMNELFVNIKVDREERPDIDQIYMRALQASTGAGGWPLTAFLTPEAEPYYLGTYFPPEPGLGRPGFRQILRAAARAYHERPGEAKAAGKRLVAVMELNPGPKSGGAPGERRLTAKLVEALDGAWRGLARRYDAVNGGFGGAPKFPPSLTIELLLRRHLRTGDAQALEMSVHTLRRMASGGIRDHLAGGFHRYSVDSRWLVPHFEKMLYDNALLALAYLDAWRAGGENDLRRIAESALDYVAADLRSPEGAFFASRDADSEGEEGAYYVWSASEVKNLLGSSHEIFAQVYDVSPAGNFEGRNILHLPRDLTTCARARGMSERELESLLGDARKRLLGARAKRPAPFRDEKLVTCWAALAVRAFAEAGATWARADYLSVAVESAEFIWENLRPKGSLVRSWIGGRNGVHAFLEDYAALGNAFVSLHAATLDPRWLARARELADEIPLRFGDRDDPGILYDSPADGEKLVVRPRELLDNATPSGTSLAVELFTRIGPALGNAGYRERALALLGRLGSALLDYGPAFGRMLSAADRTLAEPTEVLILAPPVANEPRTGESRGTDAKAVSALVRTAFSVPNRNLTVVGSKDGTAVPGSLADGREPVGGLPTVWVCRDRVCRLPVTDADAMRKEIGRLTPSAAAGADPQ